MRKHGVYFLQKKGVLGWDTIEQSKSMAVLQSSLIREVDGDDAGELRVVAGDFVDATGTWSYRQIFYSDQNSVGISLGDDGGDVDMDAANDEAPAPSWPPPNYGSEYEDDDDDDLETDLDDLLNRDKSPSPDEIEQNLESLIEDSSDSDRWSFYEEVEDGDDSEEPVSITVGGTEDDEDKDDFDLGFAVPPELPKARKKRGGILKFILWLILVLFLAAIIAGVSLVIMKHPIVMPYVEKFHLEETIDKLTKPIKNLMGGESAESSGTQEMTDGVMPPSSGNEVRYVGIAPQLVGKWSPLKCDRTFINFQQNGYIVTVDNVPDENLNEVTETIEDEYHYYLRRSENLIEHFQKLSSNDIQLAGVTSENGFEQGTSQILSRCPQ